MPPLRLLLVAALLCPAGSAFAHATLAELSVYDRAERRRIEVHRHHGRAYVAGKAGNEFLITLHNRTGEDLLAVVSVDGVNVITGETMQPFERASPMPAEVLTLYYDSRANLVARGLIREPLAAIPDYGSLPGFAPDPPAVNWP